MARRTWTTADYDEMSWHDCHVHGFRLVEGDHGTGEIEFDLDYILEWRRSEEKYQFVVAPVKLCFHGASDLQLAIDWKKPSAGLTPFSISGIERRTEARSQYVATLWRMEINWPAGYIDFEATGFTQVAWGREVTSPNQCLSPAERSDA